MKKVADKLSPMTENILSLADNTPGYGREKLLEELKVSVEDTELYTPKEVAKILKITTRTVNRWQKEDGLCRPSTYQAPSPGLPKKTSERQRDND